MVEQQIVEIEKQNGVINALEREMLRLKAMYEAAVEQRNFAGVQLIDRNDELCVLYEKSNIQETTLKVRIDYTIGGSAVSGSFIFLDPGHCFGCSRFSPSVSCSGGTLDTHGPGAHS